MSVVDAFSTHLISTGWVLDDNINRLLTQLIDDYAGMDRFTKVVDGVVRDIYVDSDCVYISNPDCVGIRRIEFSDPTLFDRLY